MVQKGLGWLLRETAKADAMRDGTLPDEYPRERTAAGIANGVRDPSTRRQSKEDSGEACQIPTAELGRHELPDSPKLARCLE